MEVPASWSRKRREAAWWLRARLANPTWTTASAPDGRAEQAGVAGRCAGGAADGAASVTPSHRRPLLRSRRCCPKAAAHQDREEEDSRASRQEILVNSPPASPGPRGRRSSGSRGCVEGSRFDPLPRHSDHADCRAVSTERPAFLRLPGTPTHMRTWRGATRSGRV